MPKIENYDFELEDKYVSEEYETITLYFIGPKDMVADKYPDAESTELSVEFPINNPNCKYATVMISPTKDGSDYDWYDKDLSPYEIEELISCGADKGIKGGN